MTSSKFVDDCLYSASRIFGGQRIFISESFCFIRGQKISTMISFDFRLTLSFIWIVWVSQATTWSLKFMLMPIYSRISWLIAKIIRCLMTQNSHLHKMCKIKTFVSWDWNQGLKMSQTHVEIPIGTKDIISYASFKFYFTCYICSE
jgi:hypothetical protein